MLGSGQKKIFCQTECQFMKNYPSAQLKLLFQTIQCRTIISVSDKWCSLESLRVRGGGGGWTIKWENLTKVQTVAKLIYWLQDFYEISMAISMKKKVVVETKKGGAACFIRTNEGEQKRSGNCPIAGNFFFF